MFQKRRLKKERAKYRFKILLVSLVFLSLLIVGTEYAYLNFSFGRAFFISPIAKENQSKLAILQNELNKNMISYSAVNANSDGSFIVELKDGGEVILSSKKDVESQLSSLQLILSRLTIEGKTLKKLDFRFSNPVVSF